MFPEDESQRPNLKFLASAKAWMKQKEMNDKNENQADSNS